jgi:hypothetical protein
VVEPEKLTVVTPDDADSGDWDLLLDGIDSGTVVPIVGRDLLTVSDGERPALLYDLLAARLAKRLKLSSDPTSATNTGALNAVASQHILQGGDPDDIYRAVAAVMKELTDVPIPQPLLKLAAIEKFPVFVTTTFDSLLTRAVEQVKGQPDVLAFSAKPRAVTDIERTPGRSLVYHLFGRVSSLQDYVVTEEDALEFVFRLHDARNQEDHFIHQLADKSLLLIGCSFPSWFVRFFLRLTRGKRLLYAPRERAAFIVDPYASQDAGLLQFLNAFRTRTLIFAQSTPQTFVERLSQRWSERISAGAAEEPMPAGGVFVSYASEDRAAAKAIVDALRARGLQAWYDRDELRAGDRWKPKIARNLQQAYAFVPVISQQSARSTLRAVRYEWSEAVERNKEVASDDKFIFPVIIGDVSPDDDALPAEFRAAQWTPLTGGALNDSFFDDINRSIRRKLQGARR